MQNQYAFISLKTGVNLTRKGGVNLTRKSGVSLPRKKGVYMRGISNIKSEISSVEIITEDYNNGIYQLLYMSENEYDAKKFVIQH